MEIELQAKRLTGKDIDTIERSFSKRHKQLFAFSDPGRELELLTLKVRAVGSMPRPEAKKASLKRIILKQAIKGFRNVYFSETKGFVKTIIYDGDSLRPGNTITGPAVVEEPAMTLVVPPKFRFKIDAYGSYIST